MQSFRTSTAFACPYETCQVIGRVLWELEMSPEMQWEMQTNPQTLLPLTAQPCWFLPLGLVAPVPAGSV